MEKTKREAAVKKLERELKEEKKADIIRRREITQERKKAAEERQRLEEDKAKVRMSSVQSIGHFIDRFFHIQMGARKAARLRRKAGRTKKVNH